MRVCKTGNQLYGRPFRAFVVLMIIVLFPMKSEGSDLPDSILHGGDNAVTLRRVMDSTEVSVNFRLDKINYDPSYMGNDSRLKELMNFIASIKADSTARLERLLVTSSSSPEGPYEHNRYLSHERGKTLVELIKKLDPDISDVMFEVSQVVEDWDGGSHQGCGGGRHASQGGSSGDNAQCSSQRRKGRKGGRHAQA